MNTKFFITGCVLAAVSGSAVLFTGCQPEGEPMPPGVYIRPVEKDPERVDIPKQNPVPAAPAPADPMFEPVPAAPVPEAAPAPEADKKETAPAKKDADKKVTPAKKTKKVPRKVAERKEAVKYIVKKNDNLSRIAYAYGLKVSDLKKYNDLKKDVIYPKQVLMIPPTGKVTGVSPDLNNAKKRNVKSRKAHPLPADGIHIVKPRENFTTIARYYGIALGDMIVANPGVNSNRLRIGQKLKIVPGAGKKEGETDKKPVVAPVDRKGDKGPAVQKKDEDEKKKVEPSPVEDDLFADIQSPEETAKPVEKPAETPAEKPAETPAAAAENSVDDLLGEGASADKVDKILTTPDGKTKIVLAAPTTLKDFAAKYRTTVESLLKENANLPATGELKAGTEINVSNAQ